jgi:hypothetical protein
LFCFALYFYSDLSSDICTTTLSQTMTVFALHITRLPHLLMPSSSLNSGERMPSSHGEKKVPDPYKNAKDMALFGTLGIGTNWVLPTGTN